MAELLTFVMGENYHPHLQIKNIITLLLPQSTAGESSPRNECIIYEYVSVYVKVKEKLFFLMDGYQNPKLLTSTKREGA